MGSVRDAGPRTVGAGTSGDRSLWQLAQALARAARCDGMDGVFLPRYLHNCYGAPEPDVAADVSARRLAALNDAMRGQGLPTVRFDGKAFQFAPHRVR